MAPAKKAAAKKAAAPAAPASNAASSDPRRYAQGEGYGPGQSAPADVWLNHETGKVVKSEPEKGRVLATKGDPVLPWAAEFLESNDFKG